MENTAPLSDVIRGFNEGLVREFIMKTPYNFPNFCGLLDTNDE